MGPVAKAKATHSSNLTSMRYKWLNLESWTLNNFQCSDNWQEYHEKNNWITVFIVAVQTSNSLLFNCSLILFCDETRVLLPVIPEGL